MRTRPNSASVAIVLAAAVWLGFPGTVHGNDADLEALRERRVFRAEPPWWRRALALPERLTTPVSWPMKKAMIWAEDVNLPERVRDVLYFDDERTSGWFPNLDLGGEIGTAAGIRLFHHDLFGRGGEAFLSNLVSFDTFDSDPSLEEHQLRVGLFLPGLGGAPIDFLARVFAGEDEDEDFFVRRLPDGRLRPGAETGEHDDTTYELDQVRGRVQLGVHPGRATTVALAFRPLFGDVEEGEGGEPPIPKEVDGFGGPTLLLGGGPVLEWDARDAQDRPRSGWLVAAEGGYWSAVEGEATDGGEYRYARYGVEVQRFQPTFRPDRVIVLRLALDRVEPAGGGTIPFWDLPVLDEERALRAFPRNRFRDRGALVANLEYRWPIWDTWDGFAFLDEGQVFRSYGDLSAGGFEWSAGIGARFYTADGFLFRLHFATGEEEQRFRIGLEQEF